MAVNRYKEHLVIFMEDSPYRSIVNGAMMLPNLNYGIIDLKQPSGGWLMVFENFQDNITLLQQYPLCNILLLIDFDDREGDNNFNIRTEMFKEKVPEEFKNRVFLLGVNHKESEDLKRQFSVSNFEDVGKGLIEECPDESSGKWNSEYLRCNLPEITRMRDNKLFDWLFC